MGTIRTTMSNSNGKNAMNISPIKIALTPLYQHPGRKISHMCPQPTPNRKGQSSGRLERRKEKSELRKRK